MKDHVLILHGYFNEDDAVDYLTNVKIIILEFCVERII